MKDQKLFDIYKKKDPKNNTVQIQLKVDKANIKLREEIIETENSILISKKAVQDSLEKEFFNPSDVVEKKHTLRGYELGLKELKELIKLF